MPHQRGIEDHLRHLPALYGGGKPVDHPDGQEADITIFGDNGCVASPTCLECPLSQCVLDVMEERSIRGSSIAGLVAQLIVEAWRLPGADHQRLFKAAQGCLENKPLLVERVFGPEFMEELHAHGSL